MFIRNLYDERNISVRICEALYVSPGPFFGAHTHTHIYTSINNKTLSRRMSNIRLLIGSHRGSSKLIALSQRVVVKWAFCVISTDFLVVASCFIITTRIEREGRYESVRDEHEIFFQISGRRYEMKRDEPISYATDSFISRIDIRQSTHARHFYSSRSLASMRTDGGPHTGVHHSV